MIVPPPINAPLTVATQALRDHLSCARRDPQIEFRPDLVGIANLFAFRVMSGGRDEMWASHLRTPTACVVFRPLPPKMLDPASSVALDRVRRAFLDARQRTLAEELRIGAVRTVSHMDSAFYLVEGRLASSIVLTSWIDEDVVGVAVGYGYGPPEARRARRRIILPGPPLRSQWRTIAIGDVTHNHHAYHRSQRYAIDLAPLGDGPSAVVAPIAGRVSAVRGSVPDATLDMGHAVGDARASYGNYVAIRANDVDLLLCHLAAGSVRVRVGQSVNVGDAVGIVGRSGRAEVPHLHLHAQETVGANHGIRIACSALDSA